MPGTAVYPRRARVVMMMVMMMCIAISQVHGGETVIFNSAIHNVCDISMMVMISTPYLRRAGLAIMIRLKTSLLT